MKFLVQRVERAAVTVDTETVGQIGKGLLVFIGIGNGDTKALADKYVKKLLGLRIFADENGKTNLSLKDAGGELLLVSQFTLYADCRKGNRPSFAKAGEPKEAEALYNYILSACKEQAGGVQAGRFGADMKVELVNDGPFTVILEGLENGKND